MQRFIADKNTDLSIEAVQRSEGEQREVDQRLQAAREQDRRNNAQREQDRQQEREQQRQRDQEIQSALNSQAQVDRELAERRAASPMYRTGF